MNTTPLFSKRKINSQCQNSLISILHNNNDNVLSKFGDNKNLQQYKTVSSLKNDYLIKNKASNCDINMNILNNPFISTKCKINLMILLLYHLIQHIALKTNIKKKFHLSERQKNYYYCILLKRIRKVFPF